MANEGATRLGRAAGRARSMDRPLVLLAGIAFIVQVGVAVMLPLLPLYAVSLGATPAMLGLLTSSFAIANALGGLATGFLAERFEPRRLVAGGIGFYAAANVLIATATAAIPLVAYRTLAGVGGGVSATGERLYLTSIVDRSRLAAANGILSSAGASGSVLGPVIGGVLAAISDVRAPFIVVGITSFVGAIAALFLPRPVRPVRPVRSASAPATATATATATAMAAAPAAGTAVESPVAATTPAPAAGTAVESPVAAPGSVADADAHAAATQAAVAATQAPAAVADAAWSRTTRVRTATNGLVILFLVQVAFQAGFGAFITTYAPFASERFGWSTAEIGLVFALFALGTILVGPWLGRLADRRGRRDVALASCGLIFVFPLVFVVEAPRLVVYPAAVIAGAGVTGLEAAWFALLGEATDGGRRARAFGTVASLANLGIVVGATLAAQLWERTGDVALGMVVVAVATAVSAIGLLFLPRDRGSVDREPVDREPAENTQLPA